MKRKSILKKIVALAIPMTLLLTGCGSKDTGTTSDVDPANRPETWIADRKITVQAFIDDAGTTLPQDMKNNPVAKKIKELTGIEVEVRYTAGTSDTDVLTTSIAGGDLPDLIVYYLNDSSRPEFPILLKASREDMFTDLTPYLKESEVYSKYLEDGFLPNDSKNNIVFRPEFEGASYIAHMRIPREEGSNSMPYRGGLYIQKDIAEELGVDLKAVNTQDDLYNLLKDIKEGGFKDANGNPVYPLGPSYWGPGYAWEVVNNYHFAESGGFGLLDGKITHEMETDYPLKQVEFYQKLKNEDLINPEIFTMDSSRAMEASNSGSSAIIAGVHNFIDVIKTGDYLPVGPLNDVRGDNNISYEGGKSGYAGWSIPTTTENPGEVVQFLDFLASKEGKLLWNYGVEGEHYNLVDGKPVPTQETLDLIASGDKKALQNTGAALGGQGTLWLEFIGNTDVDNRADFGELNYGESTDPDLYKVPMEMYNYNPPKEIRYVEGFDCAAYLAEFPEIEVKLKPVMEIGKDIKIKAIFAKDMNEAKKIIDDYLKQLNKAGLQEFKAELEKIYKADPKAINFR